jgi:hypothetical protein
MRRALALATLVLAAACGHPPAPALVAVAPTGACGLLGATASPDTVVVGVPDPVDLAHAPAPQDAAERFVFGTLYEPLVRLDCGGRVVPALAARWDREGPRRVRFTLRRGARFWDGTPVTSADVAAAWAGQTIAFAESLATPDARTLMVVLASADTAALRRFADPRLAVARPGVNGAPPEGTTPYRVTRWVADRVEARPVNRPGPVLEFRLAADADPRDLLDEGADLVMTGDPDALRYAADRADFDVVPLPWAWTYVATGALLSLPANPPYPWGLPDAVHGEVRLARPPFWWTTASPCPEDLQPPPYHPPSLARTIVYQAGDPMARGIAARLAAVLGEDSTPSGLAPITARGLGPEPWADALGQNRALAFVLALSRHAYATCVDLPTPLRIMPLLDARRSLIARRGRVQVVVDWDGTPRLVTP